MEDMVRQSHSSAKQNDTQFNHIVHLLLPCDCSNAARSCYGITVSPSVRLSVKRVHSDINIIQ